MILNFYRLFAFLHLRAFTYRPYAPTYSTSSTTSPPSQTPAWRSLGHAMDFRETFREIWIGTIYLFDKIRGKVPKPDLGIIREGHYESAFGRQRPLPGRLQRSQLMAHGKEMDDGLVFPVVEIDIDQEFELNGHRKWLSLNKYDRFNHPKRDRSEGLQEQIEQELEKRGYPKRAAFLCLLHAPRNSSHLQTWKQKVRVKRSICTRVAINRGGGTSTTASLNLDKNRKKQRMNRLLDGNRHEYDAMYERILNRTASPMILTIDLQPVDSLPFELTLCEPLTHRIKMTITLSVEWTILYRSLIISILRDCGTIMNNPMITFRCQTRIGS